MGGIMAIDIYLDALESEVKKVIPRKRAKLRSFGLLLDEAREVAERSFEELSDPSNRQGVSLDQISNSEINTGDKQRNLSSVTDKHFDDWLDALNIIQTPQFVKKHGFKCSVVQMMNGTSLMGYMLIVSKCIKEERPEEDLECDKTISDNAKLRYRLLDYYESIGPRNWLQKKLPEYIDIGSGRRALMLLTLVAAWVLPFELLDRSLQGNEFFILKFVSSFMSLAVFWYLFGAFYLVIDKKKSFATIPDWLHIIYPLWDYCQLYTTILDKKDFLGKPVHRVRVGRLESDCIRCDPSYKSKIDVIMSVWRPSKIKAECERAGHDHKYNCRPTERAGELIEK